MQSAKRVLISISFSFLTFSSLFMQTACDKDKNSREEELAAIAATEEITAPTIDPGAPKPNEADAEDGNAEDDEEKDKDEGKGSEELMAKGIALYAKNCDSCHGALAVSEVRGQGIKEISNAIVAVAEMKNLGSLPSIELASIAKALEVGPGKGKGNGNGKGQGMEMKEAKAKDGKEASAQDEGEYVGEG